MSIHIEVSQDILDRILSLPKEDRAKVEDAKNENGVDDYISRELIKHRSTNPGLSAFDPVRLKEIEDALTNSLNCAIVLIALCESSADIESVNKIATLLGRRHRVKTTINVQQLRPMLTSAFAKIDEQFDLHDRGHNNKAMIRKKVTATLQIISESLNHRSTKI